MVNPAPLDHLTVIPAKAAITAGTKQTYNSKAYDTYGNIIGDATASTNWNISIDAGGSWDSNVYTSEHAGDWIVTAMVSGVQGTASLTIEAAPTPIPTNVATDQPTTLPSNHSSNSVDDLIIKFLVFILASVIVLGMAIMIASKRHKRNIHWF